MYVRRFVFDYWLPVPKSSWRLHYPTYCKNILVHEHPTCDLTVMLATPWSPTTTNISLFLDVPLSCELFFLQRVRTFIVRDPLEAMQGKVGRNARITPEV